MERSTQSFAPFTGLLFFFFKLEELLYILDARPLSDMYAFHAFSPNLQFTFNFLNGFF